MQGTRPDGIKQFIYSESIQESALYNQLLVFNFCCNVSLLYRFQNRRSKERRLKHLCNRLREFEGAATAGVAGNHASGSSGSISGGPVGSNSSSLLDLASSNHGYLNDDLTVVDFGMCDDEEEDSSTDDNTLALDRDNHFDSDQS